MNKEEAQKQLDIIIDSINVELDSKEIVVSTSIKNSLGCDYYRGYKLKHENNLTPQLAFATNKKYHR